MNDYEWLKSVKELNQIVFNINIAKSNEDQINAGNALFAYTVRQDINEELRMLAENIAMLMVQKEGRELHLEFMEGDLEKTCSELHTAKHDPLTGLPNRGLFNANLDSMFEKAKKENRKLALLLLDLDRFKPVNDTYGHDAGDELLKQSANRISEAVGDSGCAGRLGGDEFAAFLPDIKDQQEACQVAQKILLSIKKPFQLEAATVFIDSSIGISFLDHTTKDPCDLVKNADVAMYEAKNAGRGRYVAYIPEKRIVEGNEKNKNRFIEARLQGQPE
ncbi:Diguanylate cyclase [Desulfamplus magnetovallimortis]|uniref:Diguanylate cyclase n=1 Tax=Desulfamplus magnetovallimortis TaxID=1246637 RepID=A0A1W1H7V6_9BACT|nr:GGDEF domain-containing protein [Desulfamplus magnetovallimortis]SLM28570.1 Diguanylate cyclase [Desulfamplus magnetovallimortis]